MGARRARGRLTRWFLLDTTFGCAGVATDASGRVVDAAPIYRRIAMGRHLNDVIRRLRAAGRFRAWHRIPCAPLPADPR